MDHRTLDTPFSRLIGCKAVSMGNSNLSMYTRDTFGWLIGCKAEQCGMRDWKCERGNANLEVWMQMPSLEWPFWAAIVFALSEASGAKPEFPEGEGSSGVTLEQFSRNQL